MDGFHRAFLKKDIQR